MKFLFTFSCICLAMAGISQNTFVTHIQSGETQSSFSKCIQLNDSNYVAVGSNVVNNKNGMLLTKMDAAGHVLASKTISVSNATNYAIQSLVKTTDGGFAIAGYGSQKTFIVKYKADLSKQWEKQYGGSGTNNSLSIIGFYQTKDSSYLMTGFYFNYTDKKNSPCLLKISKSGEVIYTKTYLSKSFSSPEPWFFIGGITETSDGNYAMLASQSGVGIGTKYTDSTIVCKITPDGKPIWSKLIGGLEFGTTCGAIASTSKNDIVVTGSSPVYFNIQGKSYPSAKILMASFSEDGESNWIKTVGPASFYYTKGLSVIQDKGGNYVFGGQAATFDATTVSTTYFNYYISLSPDGVPVWTRKTGSNTDILNENLTALTATNDGGYATCGYDRVTIGIFNLGIASIHKYGKAFQSCTEVADSIGEIIKEGNSQTITIGVDSMIITAEDFTTTWSDYGDFFYPCNSVLPVKLLSFMAGNAGNAVNISWSTVNEQNAGNFTVERSANGVSFTALQTISAKGNDDTKQDYLIKDGNPLAGTSYYRLKQTDKNGAVVYSSIATVIRSGGAGAIVSPNPVQNTIHLVLQSEQADKVSLQITDVTGKIVMIQSHTLVAGTNKIDVPAANLGKGIYFVKIVQNHAVQTLRVMKQ